MARITIVPSDNHVVIDGVARKINMAGIDSTIHAVQWFSTKGEIEYNDGKPHKKITSINPFQAFIDRWTAAAPPPPLPDPPKSEADVTVKELITQMIKDGTMTLEKITAIQTGR